MKSVDLRSDTVTRPTPEMRQAMAAAEVGDDVYRDDPTVKRLESHVAEVVGKEAGLFLPSGTQSNLAALLSHCERGDEYIVGQNAHTYRYEAGGAAVLGSIQPQPLPLDSRGRYDLAEVEAAIKPDDPHFARTRLLCFENTYQGRVVPQQHVLEVAEIARRRGLSLHLDGARLWNAAAATGLSEAELAAPFDSVSLCLSKGLGAPVGSVLVGSRELLERAFRWRKMLGGAMRQVGVLAAAGLVAVEERARLVDDHRRAQELAGLLDELPGLEVERDQVETGFVFVRLGGARPGELARRLREQGVLVSASSRMRLALHRDVDDAGVEHAARAFAAALEPETLEVG